ncbi:interleukin-like EMT inducer domain-containing protein [Alistipes indistinctus]|uniref:interleukin-like EMT inducer domain-containing protein n=1 Tax=Alistipes indistinctus TaxID=626932 RepID=UPI003A8B0E7C
MAKVLLARGQVTITSQRDAYTLTQSCGNYIFSAASDGEITSAVSVTTKISVTQGDVPVSSFRIGNIVLPPGFSAVEVDQADKSITFSIAANTATLADQGAVDIPVIVAGTTYRLSFVWSKAKAGITGTDIKILDWVKEWDTNRTQIDANTVITPKLFAGVKNADGTITGTAIGRYAVSAKTDSGTITSETVDGISVFKDGYKTFCLDNSGNVQLGRGEQFIQYDATTGKVVFGAGVSLLWVGATYIDKDGVFTGKLSATTVAAIQIDASQITAGVIDAARLNVDELKASILTAGNIEALTLNVTQGKIGGWTIDQNCIYRGTKTDIGLRFTPDMNSMTIGLAGIRGCMWRLDSIGTGALAGGKIKWDIAGNVVFDKSVSVAWEKGIDTASELARAMAFGKMLFRDPTFTMGMNGIKPYNTSENNNVTATRAANPEAPNDSGQVIEVATAGEASPGQGGFSFHNNSAANKIFITRLIAKIPVGYTLVFNTNPIGTDSSHKFLTSPDGTGEWEEYVIKVKCGSSGTFQTTNYFYLTARESVVLPIVWQLAYATVFDVTSAEKYTTTIDANGIYTGTLTAGQITTGFLAADRIAAGSIKAEKLDAASIKASIINTEYINGLSCTFTQGKIGGWTIGADNITAGEINGVGVTPIQIRTAGWGSGHWYNGMYRPYGITMTWRQYRNAGHFVFGQIAAAADAVKTGFVGIQMMDSESREYFCLSSNTALSGDREVYNSIAGWRFDEAKIWKNSVSLGADGSIVNATKWQFNNDGSGQIASGNISWDTAGKVTFSSGVSLNWKNDIQDAKNKDYGFAYSHNVIVYGEDNLFYPVVFKGGDQMLKRTIYIRRSAGERAPESWNPYEPENHGALILSIKANFGSWGGTKYSWEIHEFLESYCWMFAGAAHTGYDSMFAVFLRGGGSGGAVYHVYSDQPIVNNYADHGEIPSAPQICYNKDLIFYVDATRGHAPAARTRTTAVNEEIRRRSFMALAQNTDTTLSQHPLTYIGPTGIYTGTLTAVQVNAVDINAASIRTGTLSADRIAAGSIKAEKLDAASLKASVINTDYINGLSCTFVRGTIGGWIIAGDSLSAGKIQVGATPVQLRPTSSGSGYWYTGAYKPFGLSINWLQDGNAGHIVFGQVAAAGNAPKTGYIGIQMMAWDNSEYFCLSTNWTRSGSKEVYNRIAGWAFDHNHIWKNSVSLGSDGSIQNSTKWQLNNDGSGRVASGNIAWDAAGNVTFGASVALNWANASNQGRIYVRGTGWNHAANRMVKVNGNVIVNASGRGFALTVLNRNTLALVSHATYDTFANAANCNELASKMSALSSDNIVILTSYDAIDINATLCAQIKRCGGPEYSVSQYRMPFAFIGIPGIGKDNGLVSITGPNASDPYAEISTTVVEGVPQGMNVSGRQKTYIDGDGVYTGTVRASQVIIDSTLVVGGSSYNGSISVRDASNTVKVTLDRTGIRAIGGTIGGWNLSSSQIYSGSVVLTSGGSITNGSRWKLNADGSGQMANGNFSWDAAGKLTATGGNFKDVTIQGTIRSAFVLNDSSIWIGGSDSSQVDPRHCDNVVVVRGSWNQNINLQWTLDQSGRRICLLNYMWHNTVTQGYMDLSAPSGKYFYEDGIAKTKISFSRELVELLGFGDDKTFYGWIVTNRRDVMCANYYGFYQQIIAQGSVTCSKANTRGVTMKYKTFDGKSLQVTHTSQGFFTVYMPWSIPVDNYMVMLSGKTSAVQNTPIYASVRNQYTSYFTVTTQDDASVNDGSFNFQIVSIADFTTYTQP